MSHSDPTPPARDTGAAPVGTDGFGLTIAEGRGVLTMVDKEIVEGVRLNRLEMRIPRLTFPFNIGHGISGLSNRRHLLTRLRFTVTQSAVASHLQQRLSRAEGIRPWAFAFEPDHLALLVEHESSDRSPAALSFRLVPSLVDEALGFVIDSPRAYGPLPTDVLTAAADTLEAILGIRPKGTEASLPDPVRWLLMDLMPRRGWRIPEYHLATLANLHLGQDHAILEFRRDAEDGPHRSPFSTSRTDLAGLKRNEERLIARDLDRLLTEGRREAARGGYEKILARDPMNPFGVERLARMDIVNAERRDETLCLLERCLRVCPDRGDLVAVLAQGAALRGDSDSEKKWLETLGREGNALEKLALNMRLGRLLLEGDPGAASSRFEGCLAARPEDSRVLFAVIEARVKEGDTAAVQALISRWLNLQGTPEALSQAMVAAGDLIRRELRDLPWAAALLKGALDADPDNLDARRRLADLLGETGAVEEAILQYESLVRAETDAADREGAARALYRLGGIWISRDEKSLGIHRMKESLEQAPDHPHRRTHLAKVLADLSRWQDAAAELELALKHGAAGLGAQEFGAAALDLAKIYWARMNRPGAARRWAEEAMMVPAFESAAMELISAIDTRAPHPMVEQARALIESGDFEAAHLLYEALALEDSDDGERKSRLASAREAVAAGDFERGYHAAMAAATGPSAHRTEAILLAAEALQRQGQKQRAVQTLEQMSRSVDDQGSVELLLFAVDLAADQIADRKRARLVLEKYLDAHPDRDDVDQAVVKLLTLTADRTELAEYLIRGRGETANARLRHAAEIFTEAGQQAKAVNALTALYRQTDAIGDLFLLVSALKAVGRYETLIELLEERRGEDPRIDLRLVRELKEFSGKMQGKMQDAEASDTTPPDDSVLAGSTSIPGGLPATLGDELLKDEEAFHHRLSKAFSKLRRKE